MRKNPPFYWADWSTPAIRHLVFVKQSELSFGSLGFDAHAREFTAGSSLGLDFQTAGIATPTPTRAPKQRVAKYQSVSDLRHPLPSPLSSIWNVDIFFAQEW